MVELLAGIAITAVALTFFSDATSQTLKLAGLRKRRARIRTADPALSDH